jgi:site-specific recombinase XerD
VNVSPPVSVIDRKRDHRFPHTRHHNEGVDDDRVGPIDRLGIDEVLARVASLPAWTDNHGIRRTAHIDGARMVLDWLHPYPGDGWQQRWITSGADGGTQWIEDLVHTDISTLSNAVKRDRLLRGVTALLLCRAVLPGYRFLHSYKPRALYDRCRQVFRPDLFVALDAKAESLAIPRKQRAEALRVITKMVIHTGRDAHELTDPDILALRSWCQREHHGTDAGIGLAWVLLRDVANLPEATMAEAVRLGQRSTIEVVNRYRLGDSNVRKVLVRYLDERRPGLDHNTFQSLVNVLVGVFWADIEQHHPELDTLHLPSDVAEAWKQRARTTISADGTRRDRGSVGYFQILDRVRAFYLDIQEWAMEDPSWAEWAAPSPVRRGETDGYRKAHRAVVANMHQRVRDRLPHLPTLVRIVDEHRADQAALLATAAATPVEDTFSYQARGFRRVVSTSYDKPQYRGATPPVLVEDLATGERINLCDNEDEAFWAWAIVETLRHTGVRVEELTELTHLALISYQLPDTGEIVPMLQIVPSKANEERLLLVGPELANVLAAIITRLRSQNGGTIPLTARYDSHERITGPALPHLFQRRRGSWRWSVIGATTVRKLLIGALDRCDLRDSANQRLHYTAHDFRRLFATDAVSTGLPIHILARILGHANINTSQSYTAVFDDDLVRAYRAFLDKRRAERPPAEYRQPTDEEWRAFQQHFQERKLELGECARPYGTSCKHEFACIRCPSLRLDPAARPRLVQIITNLKARIHEARVNGWLGEVQGLQISLDAAATKLAALDRIRGQPTPGPVALGMPILTDSRRPLPRK